MTFLYAEDNWLESNKRTGINYSKDVPFFSLFIYSNHLSLSLPLALSLSLSPSVSIYLSIYLSIISIYLSIFLSRNRSAGRNYYSNRISLLSLSLSLSVRTGALEEIITPNDPTKAKAFA